MHTLYRPPARNLSAHPGYRIGYAVDLRPLPDGRFLLHGSDSRLVIQNLLLGWHNLTLSFFGLHRDRPCHARGVQGLEDDPV
jgi:hypothetical protein